jgi:UDP-N-acetylmuramoyl-tripeptide--D-alanyl-D-alanine ligase
MNHPGEMARLASIVRPDAALITIVQPEHLEGLGSLEGVARAEGELFAGLSASAVAVVNLDDPLIPPQAEACRARKLTFGRSERADVRLVEVVPRGKQGIRALIRAGGAEHAVDLAFLGEHNALNAAGAFALATALGYRPEECVRGLAQARPYARRLNLVEAPDGVTVLDDCYNANPASMAAALQTLKTLAQGGRAVAVLGDMLELGPGELEEHEKLGVAAAQSVELLALFGPRSERGFKAAGRLTEKAHFTDVDALVAWLKPQLRSGDVVLVKGSRGMRLERVVAALAGQAPAGGGH